MYVQKLVAAAVLCVSIPAAADFKTIVRAYEVEVADLRLPGTTSGTLSFKACDNCAYQTVRVTDATVYIANDHDLALDDFRMELERVANPRDEHLTVMHHLESDTITTVRVTL